MIIRIKVPIVAYEVYDVDADTLEEAVSKIGKGQFSSVTVEHGESDSNIDNWRIDVNTNQGKATD